MDFFDGIEGLERIMWLVAIPATFTFLLILIMTFIGGDVDSDVPDADGEIDADDGIGFQFFTFKNLVGFFTIFGWVGVGLLRAGMSQAITLAIATVCGLLMMSVMALIFYAMSRLVEDGTLKIENAIGRLGEVYLTIPAGSGGFGKVTINIQGSFREMEAMTHEDQDIEVGTIVKVKEVIDQHILLVRRNTNNQ